MAKMPAKPMSPPPADDDSTGAAGADSGTDSGQDDDDDAGAADDDDSEEGDESDEEVVVTITKSKDGSYMVYAGDEPEDDEGGEGDESGSEEGGEDDTQGGETDNGEDDEPEGKPADSIGSALREAMMILKDDESASSGEGTEDSNFQAGFSGGSSASPPRPGAGITQKY